MSHFERYQTEDAPPWLGDANGQLWLAALGGMKDGLIRLAKTAVYSRFPSFASQDALPYIAREVDLDIGFEENEPTRRARLKAAWQTWLKAGTKAGLIEELTRAGFQADRIQIRENKQDSTLHWSEWEIWLRTPFPFPPTYHLSGYWDDPGAAWNDGRVWANSAPASVVALLRAIVRKFRPAHSRCRQIVFVHAGEEWDETAPPGTWDDDPAATWGNDVTVVLP